MHKINTRKHKVGWFVFTFAVVLAATESRSGAAAADPSFVGVLAIAVEDGMAERLELSDEVKAKLIDLINLREDQALEIVMKNKDLPPFEQTQRLIPFVADSEQLGFALLTIGQRRKLQQIHVDRQGMSSLAEPWVAESIGLSDEQQATVKRLLDERTVDMTKGGDKERRITRAIYERKLAALLNDQQKGNWQTLAGLADADLTVAKVDAQPPTEPQSEAAESKSDEGEQADAKEPAAEDAAAAEATEDPPAAAEEAPPSEAEKPAETAEPTTDPAAETTEDTVPAEAAEPAEGDADTEMKPAKEPPVAKEVPPTTDSEEPAETTESDTEPTEDPAPAEAIEPAEGAADTDTEPDAAETAEEGGMVPDDATEGQPATAEEADTESTETAEQESSEDQQTPTAAEDSADDPQPDEAVAETEPAPKELPDELRFNFEAAPWKDVLKWFADTAGLSLDSTRVPLGTFNYRDDRVYTVDEAMDMLNSYLLTKGYTLVRRERILIVLDYESEIPKELVTFVAVDDLDNRGKYEYIKTVFPLARMSSEDAADMVDPFLGPHGQVIPFPGTRQIMVLETGGTLREIRDLIAQIEDPLDGGAATVVEVKLENISAEEFLTIARPLLGLAEGENSGDGINISIALDAKTMYVTGEPDKLLLIRELVKLLDKEPETTPPEEAEVLELRTYIIKAADPEVVLRVLQTLLANMPGVRMEMDVTSGKLVAMAYPDDHARIDEAIKILEGQAKQFKVIQLDRLDPELAVAAVNKFFGLVTGDDQEAAVRADAPIVDGDPITMQLWVRGTTVQIEQIEDLVAKLEAPLLEEQSGGTFRMIPLTGPDAIMAVENAQLMWGRENKIRMVTPSALAPSRIRLRTITPLDEENADGLPDDTGGVRGLDQLFDGSGVGVPGLRPIVPVTPPAKGAGQLKPAPTAPAAKTPLEKSADRWPGDVRFQFASQPAASEPAATEEAPSKTSGAEIRVAITPGGIFIASDDVEALDEFEKRLRAVSGPAAFEQREITVFYLKYAKAEVAHALLQEILSGHVDDSAGSLLGDMTTDLLGGGLLGGLLGGLAGGGGGDDTTTIQATGMVSIVPDPRVNALMVEANPTDLKLIEELLKVIDRESSVTDIQTAGTPYPIVIKYASADEVAAVVREVFASRIATAAGRGRQQPSPEDLIRALRGQRGGRDQQSRGEEQKMTIGVDPRTNSIIVVAPEPLYLQVKALVELIDQPGPPDQDYVDIYSVTSGNGEVIKDTLEKVLERAGTGGRSSTSGQSGGGSPGGPTPDQIRQRTEMFQRIQAAGAFGRPGGMMGGRGGPGGMMGGRGGPPSGGRGGSSRGGRGGR